MHWRKLSLFNISLALYTTGIFRIGVTKNITAISIPWRNRPYRDRNAQLSTTVMQKRFEDCYDGDVVHFIPI